MDEKTRFKLSHAVIEYDRKQSTRRGYNMYALSHYCAAVQAIEADVDTGIALRAAILEHLTGRLADAVLRAVGLPKMTDNEARM